jgi:hypothetical protein
MKIISKKIAENKQDSFWYRGETIAEIVLPNGSKLIAETRGAIEVQFEVGGTKFVGDNALIEADNLKLTDEDLFKLYDDDLWHFNNWFVIIELYSDGSESDDLIVEDRYDEIIESLLELEKEYLK